MKKRASSFQISALSECADVSKLRGRAEHQNKHLHSQSELFEDILRLNPLKKILFESNIKLVCKNLRSKYLEKKYLK